MNWRYSKSWSRWFADIGCSCVAMIQQVGGTFRLSVHRGKNAWVNGDNLEHASSHWGVESAKRYAEREFNKNQG